MNIISWNVNGLRACYKKGAFTQLLAHNADIVAIQETKSTIDQLPHDLLSPQGYYAYFDSAKEKKGYSGVAVYTKKEPKKVLYGLGKEEYDLEGRCLTLFFEDLVFVTTYFPNGGKSEEHFQFKLRYYDQFFHYIQALEKKYHTVIFCGDFNVAHTEIDLARPKENSNQIGFLPIERAFIDRLINAKYIDTFRYLHKKDIRYSWWDQKTRARERNVGWRIDYIFTTPTLKEKIQQADIFTEMTGSDHAPTHLKVSL